MITNLQRLKYRTASVTTCFDHINIWNYSITPTVLQAIIRFFFVKMGLHVLCYFMYQFRNQAVWLSRERQL
jgi:hypothetical protein